MLLFLFAEESFVDKAKKNIKNSIEAKKPIAKPRLLFFAGSLRKDSENKKLAKKASEFAQNADVTYIDLSDYPLPLYDEDFENCSGIPENAKALKELIASHDGLFIASPVYNGSFSAALKNMIDWVSRLDDGAVFKGKTVVLSSACSGHEQCLNQLYSIFKKLGSIVLPQEIEPNQDENITKAVETFVEITQKLKEDKSAV